MGNGTRGFQDVNATVPGAEARLYSPFAAALDPLTDVGEVVFLADTYNHAVRALRIDTGARARRCPRSVPESSSFCPRIVLILSPNRPRFVPELSSFCPRIVPVLSPNRPRSVPELSPFCPCSVLALSTSRTAGTSPKRRSFMGFFSGKHNAAANVFLQARDRP